jgi:cell division protein FtsN
VLQDQRLFKRFDIDTPVEFKPLNESTEVYFYGIMKNFSFGGFGLETRYDDLEPGEKLEIQLKQPDIDLFVTDRAQVIWKDRRGRFERRMGIKLGIQFMEKDADNRIKMFEIASANSGELIQKRERVSEKPPVSGAGKPEDNTAHEKMEQIHEDISSQEEENQKKYKWLPMLTALLVAVVLGYSIFFMLIKSGKSVNDETSGMKESAYQQDIDMNNPLPVIEELRSNRSAVQDVPHPGKGPEEQGNERASSSKESLTDIPRDGKEYFIQVGSWRNPNYARQNLEQLKKYYPDSYITAGKNFNVVRIPGVKTREEGVTIAKDIEKKFNIKPIIVLKTR